MQFEPMIKARINSFKERHALQDIQGDRLFELFVNDTILRSHQPDFGVTGDALLDECSVGGADDMGIDGLAVKVNGSFVSTTQDIDEIIELNKQISAEFVFIQSKNKDKLDSSEFGKFADGIIDYLSESHNEPHNEKIDAFIQLKDYLFSDSIILRWKSNPIVRVYYVFMGQLRENKHILAKKDKLISDIMDMQSYDDATVSFVDNKVLKRLCEENENSFSAVLNVIDNFGLNEVEGVDNSLIVLFSATELIKIITTEDRRLRQALFTDNVRDYQGETDINSEIRETIESAPSNFALLNNGITIVCSSVTVSNRKLTLVNPQIVNGCQTCNVIFDAFIAGIDIDKVTLLAKVIASEKDDLTTSVIRGTNSQNVVYNEAFETTRDFHKHLEEYINAIQSADSNSRIYYERRSRQYAREPNVSSGRIIGLRALTQSFVSVFMRSPHLGTSHEAILLKKYKNSIYVEGQSFQPYYVAALMCLNFEDLRRRGMVERDVEKYKHHIMFIVCESVAGVCPSINNVRWIDEYCDKLLPVIIDAKQYTKEVKKAYDLLKRAQKKWIETKGKQYRSGLKDNSNFTKFLKTYMQGGNIDKIKYDDETELVFRGRVIKCRQDRYGLNFGFIQSVPNDVFFHESDNENLSFADLYGKTVLYEVFADNVSGDDRARIIEVLQDEQS